VAAADHPIFVAPADIGSAVWRYMDFAKFASLVVTKSLFFSNATALGDPFEGSVSARNAASWGEWYSGSPDMIQMGSHIRANTRQHTYVNCWHLNSCESAAMWNIYGRIDSSIAVVTTFDRLRRALPDSCHIGQVNYIDYDSEYVPEGNAMAPFLYKRNSYEYEREVRALIQEFPKREEIRADGTMLSGIDVTLPGERGIEVVIDLNQLIERVLISPAAPIWLDRIVASLAEKYGLAAPVTRSKLSDPAIF
jgi:hypothetical protein